MNADKAIFTSAVITLGSTVGASVLPKDMGGHGKLPAAKLLIGTGLTFTGLSILGDLAPSIATPLAASIAITVLLYYGVPLLDKNFTQAHQANTPANHSKQPNSPSVTVIGPGGQVTTSDFTTGQFGGGDF